MVYKMLSIVTGLTVHLLELIALDNNLVNVNIASLFHNVCKFWLDTFMRQVTMQHNIYDRLLLLAAARLYTCRYQELQLMFILFN